MSSIRERLKSLILRSLKISDIDVKDFGDDQPLDGGQIEVDSIDILQLIVDIEREFGIRLIRGKFDRGIWKNVSTLADAIETLIADSHNTQS